MGAALDRVKEYLSEYGYNVDGVTSLKDAKLKKAIALLQKNDARIERLKEMTLEPLVTDGVIGDATSFVMKLPRCGMADMLVEEPLIGGGPWKGCHGLSDYHCAIGYIDRDNFPSFIDDGMWKEILSNVQKAYAQIGLLWRFVDSNWIDILTGEDLEEIAKVNTDMTFTIGSGWIGLAIVGSGSMGCSSRIWAKFDYRYRGGSSRAAIVNQWTTLIMHELGHNCGLQHRSGGVMNPGIINGLPMSWIGDPHERTLKSWFGGKPAPIPRTPNDPPEPPDEGPDKYSRITGPFEISGMPGKYATYRIA